MNQSYSECEFKLHIPTYVISKNHIKFDYRFVYKKGCDECVVCYKALLIYQDRKYESLNSEKKFNIKKNMENAQLIFEGDFQKSTMLLKLMFLTSKGEKISVVFSFINSDKANLQDVSKERMSIEEKSCYDRICDLVANNLTHTEKCVSKLKASDLNIHCLSDYNKLIKIKEVKVEVKNDKSKKFVFPMYECPKCRIIYTSVKQYKDSSAVTLDKVKYINILPENDAARYEKYRKKPKFVVSGSKCYVYGIEKPTVCRVCNGIVGKVEFLCNTKKKKEAKYFAKQCMNCDTYYVPYYVYMQHNTEWSIYNSEELLRIEKELYKRREMKENKKREKATNRALWAEAMRQLHKPESEEKEAPFLKEEIKDTISCTTNYSIHKDIHSIAFKDFVVRRTTFKCRHNNHQLKDINVSVDIIDKYGEVKSVKTVAGYCPNCNVYFIMESVYQNLKKKGTIACRLSDEKAYLNGNTYVNGMMLAQESILRQYGYNVSQEEGLTEARRRKILALLVDNKVMTRNDIISYLDFFINQRKYQHKFEKAIDKWTRDKEFIANYKSGEYSQFGVTRIYRKY